MPSVPEIVLQRNARRAARRRRPAPRMGLGCSLILSLMLVGVAVALALFYIDLTRDLPSINILPVLLDPPNGALLQPTRLYDRSQQHILLTLENPAGRNPLSPGRRYLPLDPSASVHLPVAVAQATVAAADPGFWSHPGFTLAGLGQPGRPTLAQRLVSNLILWDEPAGLRRDLRERLLAFQITAHFGRDRVLEWYLNSAKFGRWIYGIDAAARAYFAKPAEELSLAEAAFLAVVAEAPELNPLEAPQVPLERQAEVIQTMLTQGVITGEQARQALQTPLRFRENLESQADPAQAFTSLVLEQLSTQYPQEWIARGGLRIRTSLDYDLQMQVACTVQIELKRRSGAPLTPEDNLAADGSPCEAARLLPTLPGIETSRLTANVIVLDPTTGEVLALVGDLTHGLDPVHPPGHAMGTLVTPLIYLTAFTRGWSPASLAWDIPSDSPGSAGQAQESDQPDNLSISTVYHGPVSLRAALANDYQAPAIGLLSQIGAAQVWRTAQQLGLESLELSALQTILESRSLAVGGAATLVEIGQAFGVFANQGVLAGQTLETPQITTEITSIHPITALSVEGVDHQIWLDCRDELRKCTPLARPVLSPQLAYLMTHVLSDETARWPSLRHPNPLEIGRPAGAKIGKTGDGRNAWTIGYTPQIVVGVWVGKTETQPPAPTPQAEGENPNERPAPEGSAPLVSSASLIWHAVIKYASMDDPPQSWPMPAGISRVEVCSPSGMLPTEICPSIVPEVFIAGNEPMYPDTLYQAYRVNRETGRLATVFTPPALVETRVYMIVPPQAEAWARAAGLPVPPDAYDVVSLAAPPLASARILSPAMFSYVAGKVQIEGTAGGDDFAFYRLQAGKGLNPQEWLQIGSDSQKPVEDGLLGEWDTQGLSGLYALQLLVIRTDQRVDSAIIQVTIDNQPPEVAISQPAPGQLFTTSKDSTAVAVFEALASDDLALAQVEFYLDQRWLATFSQPPFVIAWKLAPGKHTLLVKAFDRAGNSQETSLEFEVAVR